MPRLRYRTSAGIRGGFARDSRPPAGGADSKHQVRQAASSLKRFGTGMKKSQQIEPWTVNGSTTIIKDKWIDLRADDCLTPGGVSISPYYVLRYPDWAHTVCLDQDDRICRSKRKPKSLPHFGKFPIDTGLTSTPWRGRRASRPSSAELKVLSSPRFEPDCRDNVAEELRTCRQSPAQMRPSARQSAPMWSS